MPKETPTGDEPKRVPLHFTYPESVIPISAQTVAVQHTAEEFFVSFFAHYPPLNLGTKEEQLAVREAITSVEARCVGRACIDAQRAKQFLVALADNLQKYEKKYGKIPGPTLVFEEDGS